MGAIAFMIYTKNYTIGIDFFQKFMNMKSRGPNQTNYIIDNNMILSKTRNINLYLTRDEIQNYIEYNVFYGYHRLSINDNTFNALQPFKDPIEYNILNNPEIKNRVERKLLCNGEIYNYPELVKNIHTKNLQSKSDVEILLPLYIQKLEESNNTLSSLNAILDVINNLDGEWTFVLTENINTYKIEHTNIFVARDIFGTRPLYYITHNKDMFYFFVTELKSIPKKILDNYNYSIKQFPIGNIWSFKDGFIEYYNWEEKFTLENCTINHLQHNEIDEMYINIRNKLYDSVKSRSFLNEEGSIGILLSGGFDSSLITSILAKLSGENNLLRIHTFSLVKCKNINSRIDNFISTLEQQYNIDIFHHQLYIDQEFTFDISTKIDDIIYNVETYDPKIVRESITFDILYKYIKEKTDVKVVLSGEGLDELCGGFSQLYELDDEQFIKKTIHYIKNMCEFDIPKHDKLAGKYGLEVRFPFLYKDFVEYICKIHPTYKRPVVYKANTPPIEKYLIRKAFQLDNDFILPEEILWSPATKDNCYTNLVYQHIDNLVSKIPDQTYNQYIKDNKLINCHSKEAYLYRKIFIKYFGKIFNGFGYSL